MGHLGAEFIRLTADEKKLLLNLPVLERRVL